MGQTLQDQLVPITVRYNTSYNERTIGQTIQLKLIDCLEYFEYLE